MRSGRRVRGGRCVGPARRGREDRRVGDFHDNEPASPYRVQSADGRKRGDTAAPTGPAFNAGNALMNFLNGR